MATSTLSASFSVCAKLAFTVVSLAFIGSSQFIFLSRSYAGTKYRQFPVFWQCLTTECSFQASHTACLDMIKIVSLWSRLEIRLDACSWGSSRPVFESLQYHCDCIAQCAPVCLP